MEAYLISLSGWFAETYSITNLEKPRLFFWKTGMQRQIWSQQCRCIKHFSRGINVVLLHRLCCFSLQNAILLSEDLCRKDRAVLILGESLQLFTVTFATDSMHERKACKKENSETTFAFNEGQFGDFRKSHIVISQESEETSAISAFFFYKMAFWGYFVPLKMSVKHTWRAEREILSERSKVRYNHAAAF